MADRLTPTQPKYDRATFLAKVTTYDDLEIEIVKAKGEVSSLVRRRTGLRREMSGLGIDLQAFDRMREFRELSGAERERKVYEEARMMAFVGKPIGTQAKFEFDLEADLKGKMAWSVAELKAIDIQGYKAGLANHDRYEVNTWSPGTEAFTRFDNGFTRGNEEYVKANEDAESGSPEALKRSAKRRAAEGEANGHAKGTEPEPEAGGERAAEPQPTHQAAEHVQ